LLRRRQAVNCYSLWINRWLIAKNRSAFAAFCKIQKYDYILNSYRFVTEKTVDCFGVSI
jgi:hypothetical protein